jgi:hypothetical protein
MEHGTNMTYAPLQLIVAYIAITFSLAVLGPVIYYGFDILLTGTYIALVIAFVVAGYSSGARSPLKTAVPWRPGLSNKPTDIRRFFNISLALALVGLGTAFAEQLTTAGITFSFSQIGDVYIKGYEGYERNSGNYSTAFIIYTLAYVPTFIATVWGIYYYRHFSRVTRYLVVLLILGTLVLYTFGSGKQKQLGDTVIICIAVAGIRYARSGKLLNMRYVIGSLVVGFGTLMGFVAILAQRYSAASITALNVNQKTLNLMSYDLDHPVFSILGFNSGLAVSAFTSYLSQGYFGLSLALHTESTWSYMAGFSYAISVALNRGLGLPWAYYHTYPYIVGVETGWGESKWSTAFPSFASDFTFTGTLFLFCFLAYCYAKIWRESVDFENPFAILLFTVMTMGAFFLPANNQLFISPGSTLNVFITVILFLRYHRRFNVAEPAVAPGSSAVYARFYKSA